MLHKKWLELVVLALFLISISCKTGRAEIGGLGGHSSSSAGDRTFVPSALNPNLLNILSSCFIGRLNPNLYGVGLGGGIGALPNTDFGNGVLPQLSQTPNNNTNILPPPSQAGIIFPDRGIIQASVPNQGSSSGQSGGASSNGSSAGSVSETGSGSSEGGSSSGSDGQQLFQKYCRACHGSSQPSLVLNDNTSINQAVTRVQNRSMPPNTSPLAQSITDSDRAKIVQYLRSLLRN